MSSDMYTARPRYTPPSRGDYQPPKPYMRPGSHPDASPVTKETTDMGFMSMSVEERREWLYLWLVRHGPATRQRLAEEAQLHNKSEITRLDLAASELRKLGSLVSKRGEDGVTRWVAVPVEADAVDADHAEQEAEPHDGVEVRRIQDAEPLKATLETAEQTLDATAVTGDGRLMLQVSGDWLEVGQGETQQLAKLLQVNQRLIWG